MEDVDTEVLSTLLVADLLVLDERVNGILVEGLLLLFDWHDHLQALLECLQNANEILDFLDKFVYFHVDFLHFSFIGYFIQRNLLSIPLKQFISINLR